MGTTGRPKTDKPRVPFSSDVLPSNLKSRIAIGQPRPASRYSEIACRFLRRLRIALRKRDTGRATEKNSAPGHAFAWPVPKSVNQRQHYSNACTAGMLLP